VTRGHVHYCGVCGLPFACEGEWVTDTDGTGWCDQVSRYDDLLVCRRCLEAQEAACERDRLEEWGIDVLLGYDA